MYVCMYVCMYVRMYVCMYVCMHACIYVCMHTCTHIYIYIHRTYVCLYAYIYFFKSNTQPVWVIPGCIIKIPILLCCRQLVFRLEVGLRVSDKP